MFQLKYQSYYKRSILVFPFTVVLFSNPQCPTHEWACLYATKNNDHRMFRLLRSRCPIIRRMIDDKI